MADELEASGHCYCGAVTYRVSLKADEAPLFTAYCHCDSCRRAHAAPLYQVVCVTRPAFEIQTGADGITEFQKPGGPVRAFCSTCGSKIYNRFPNWRPGGKEPLAFFPATLDAAVQTALPTPLRARKNVNASECILDFAKLDELR